MSTLHIHAGVKPGPQPVTLQLSWMHQFQFAGYYMALEKGFFRQAGFDVNIKEGTPDTDSIDEVLNGAAEFGVGGTETVYARLHGKPLTVLAVIFQHSPFGVMSLASSDIDTPQDLAGQRVMMMDRIAISDIRALLQREGVPQDAIMPVAHTFDIEALINGQVDAYTVYLSNEPFLMEQRGIAFRVMRPADYGVDFYGDMLFTTETMAMHQPAAVRDFRDACRQGWAYAMHHPEETAELIAQKYNPQKTHAHLLYEAKVLRQLMLPDLVPIGHINPGRFEKTAQILQDLGLIPDDIDIKQALSGFIFTHASHMPDTRMLMVTAAIMVTAAALFGLLVFINRRLRQAVFRRTRRIEDLNQQLRREIRQSEQVREILALSERRFRSIVQDQSELICRMQPDGTILFVNSALCRFFGKTHAQLIRHSCTPMILEEDVPRLWEAVNKMTPEHPVQVLEHRSFAADGTLRWLRWTGRGFFDDAGSLQEIQGVAQDITREKEAYEALLNSEARYRLVLENSGAEVAVYDDKGYVLFMNNLAAAAMGAEQGDAMVGRHINDLFPAPYAEKHFSAIRHVINAGCRRHVEGKTVIDGQLRDYDIIVVPFLMPGCSNRSALVVCRNITERKQAEQALRESERKYRNLVESAPDAIILYDAGGYVIECNEAACLLLQKSREDLLHSHIYNVTPPSRKPHADDQESTLHWMLDIDGVFTIQKDSENTIDVWRIGVPLVGDNGELHGVLTYTRDITFRKQAEEEQKRLNAKLSRLNSQLEQRIRERTRDLQESEARYRAVVEDQTEYIVRFRADGTITFVNEAACRFSGRTREELQGRSFFPMMQPEIRRELEELLHSLSPEKPAALTRHPWPLADGSVVWTEWINRALFDEDHRLVEYQAVGRDITEQQKTAEALQLAHNELEDRVRQRTAELAQTNESLRKEITERRQAEQEKEAYVQGLQTVVRIADRLIQCETLDALFRSAVELSRDELGLERCSIFLDMGNTVRGTYGVDSQGHTVNEQGHDMPKTPEWAACFEIQNAAVRWYSEKMDLREWNGRNMMTIGKGWVARTPICRADGRPIAVFFNDSAISGSPIDPVKQNVLNVLCSLLGDIIQRKRVEEALRKGEARLKQMYEDRRQLAQRLLDVQEEERRRLSALLHDHFGQMLTLSSMELDSLQLEDEPGRQKIQTIMKRMQSMLMNTRSLAASLRPPVLDDLGLASALESLAEEFSDTRNIRITVEIPGDLPVMSAEVQICLYRVVQEGLTNIARHAGPCSAQIKLQISDHRLRVDIRDDGNGLPDAYDIHHDGGIGLLGMRERLQRFNGSVVLQHGEHKGAWLHIEIPLDQVGNRKQ
jgi:PAS domain S-box-containing protein